MLCAEQAELARLADGHVQALDRQRVLRAAVDVALARADRVARDRHAFEQAVGVALDDAAVHEGAGVALVRVADHVLGLPGRAAGELPLQAGRETGPAAAAQAGGLHLGQHLGRGHPLEHLAEGRVAVAGDVLADVLRVDHAAVAQRDALLLGVEGDLAVVRDGPVLEGLLVGQALDDASLDQRFLDQVRHVLGLDLAVEDPLGVDHHDRAHGAEPAAAGLDDADLAVQAVARDFALQGGEELPRLGRCTARSLTDHHVGSRHGLCHTRPPFRLSRKSEIRMSKSETGQEPTTTRGPSAFRISGFEFRISCRISVCLPLAESLAAVHVAYGYAFPIRPTTHSCTTRPLIRCSSIRRGTMSGLIGP